MYIPSELHSTGSCSITSTGSWRSMKVASRIIAFLTDYAVEEKIIDHLKLTFIAERPPPPHIAYQEVLMAAESGGEYFS